MANLRCNDAATLAFSGSARRNIESLLTKVMVIMVVQDKFECQPHHRAFIENDFDSFVLEAVEYVYNAFGGV